jgi:hypothetical protein
MGLFNRAAQASIDPRWDDPRLGLSKADFQRWPGRNAPKRVKLIAQIEQLVAVGSVQLPPRLIGQCRAYDRHLRRTQRSQLGAVQQSTGVNTRVRGGCSWR